MWNEIDLPENEILWQESDDVYQPIIKPLYQFILEKNITHQKAQVYITKDALGKLIKHLASNLRIEQGGILFGHAYCDPNNRMNYVEVTAAVPASATIGSSSHLEFTSESWLGIMEYAKKAYPKENIVGWYHSHPNIGVFMSATDRRTQQAFFHHPWSVSIVYDPVREEIGCFLGNMAVPVKAIVLRTKSLLQENVQKTAIAQQNEHSKIVGIQLALVCISTVSLLLTVILFWMTISHSS
jgi:proteasome lid subunit RPN8/RPN11